MPRPGAHDKVVSTCLVAGRVCSAARSPHLNGQPPRVPLAHRVSSTRKASARELTRRHGGPTSPWTARIVLCYSIGWAFPFLPTQISSHSPTRRACPHGATRVFALSALARLLLCRRASGSVTSSGHAVLMQFPFERCATSERARQQRAQAAQLVRAARLAGRLRAGTRASARATGLAAGWGARWSERGRTARPQAR
jgi:hypothetical protein